MSLEDNLDFKKIPEVLLADKAFILKGMEAKNGYEKILRFIAPELTKNREFFLAAVKLNGYALKFVPHEFQDEELVLAAINQNALALEHAPLKFRKNKKIVLAAVKKKGGALEYADPVLRKDKAIVLVALKRDGESFRYVDPELQKDKEVVLAAVTQDGWVLEFVDPLFQRDREVVLAAVKQYGLALYYASSELREDKEVVLAAVNQRGLALEYAHVKLRKDKEVVLAAIRQDLNALDYANPTCSYNKEIILAIAQKSAYHFNRYVDPELKGDRKFLLECIAKGADIYEYIGEDFKLDKQFELEAIALNPRVLFHVRPANFYFTKEREVRSYVKLSSLPMFPLVNDKIMKIRKQEIQNLLFSIAEYLGKKNIENLLHKNKTIGKSYPSYLQTIALSLKLHFQESDISPYLEKLAGNKFKSLIKDQNTGVQEALVKLFIIPPCLQDNEIMAFFEELPDEPIEFKKYIARVSNFISFANDEERKDLVNILKETKGRKEKLIQPCVAFLSRFVSQDVLNDLDQFLLSPAIDPLFSYLKLHKDNQSLYSDIEFLLNAIISKTLLDERYLPKNLHLQALQEQFPAIFKNWKTLSSYPIETSFEKEGEAARLTFKIFLDQKLRDGHLHQELAHALKTGGSFSDSIKKECVETLKQFSLSTSLPNQDQVTELKELLQSAHLATNEFEHDLDSLIQKQASLAKVEISDRWEDTLLCGIEGSCQRIDGIPSFNQCLLAYVLDGKNQMLCVKDPKGNIIGRSILRLLFKDDGTPCIFMERFYGNASVQAIIERAACEIGRKMELELYQEGEGVMLESLGSSVSFEYSDAAARVTNGVFQHSGCLMA